jgi:hypothetical protein
MLEKAKEESERAFSTSKREESDHLFLSTINTPPDA